MKRLGIERLVPGCTDVSIAICCAIAGGSPGLDRPATNERLARKSLFRDLCVELGLPSPLVVAPGGFPRDGRFIAKPVDCFSGRGMTVFDGHEPAALAAALQRASTSSPSGAALIEEFVAGQLYSWSAFIESGWPDEGVFVREGGVASPFTVDTSMVEFDMPQRGRDAMRSAVREIAAALDLTDGLLHIQFIFDGEQVFLIEVMRRCPGDLYATLISLSTGDPYAARYASVFTGETFAAVRHERRYVLHHTASAPEAGFLGGLAFQGLPPIRAAVPLLASGAAREAGYRGRVAILFFEAADEPEREEAWRMLMQHQAYSIS